MNRGRELLVGGVIIAAVAVALVGTLWLKGTNWGQEMRPVEVLLPDVAQLSPGNRVTLRGVQIGRVGTISVEPGGHAVRVVLNLEPRVPIPDDAVVLLSPESFFGDWQAEIAGRDRYPFFSFYEVPEEELARDTLVLGGYALPELSRLTASAEQISNNLRDLTDRLEIAFNEETAQNLATAIANLEAITSQLRDFVASQSETAAKVTRAADSAFLEIREASVAARTSFRRIQELMGDTRMDSIVTYVAEASGSIRDLTGELSGSSDDVRRLVERADSAFARLDRITAQVEAGDGALGRLLSDSTLAVQAEDVLNQLNLLLQDLRENPRRYVRLSIF
ncbi:MAG: MlaD family protein [Gemmatimonadota bacterium]